MINNPTAVILDVLVHAMITQDIEVLIEVVLLNAIPLGTCEKAKACEFRESETCN